MPTATSTCGCRGSCSGSVGPSPRRRRGGGSLPRGSGSFAVIRALIRLGDAAAEDGVTVLASRAGVSQPRASQVPGLPTALNRAPVMIGLEMHRLNGAALHANLPFPDEVSALVLQALATRIRVKDTDITDIWRCLEAAFAAGVTPAVFADGIRAESASVSGVCSRVVAAPG